MEIAACVCDSAKHTGDCEDETGRCVCKPQFAGLNCDRCAPGHYSPPECKPCDCSVNGTLGDTCMVLFSTALFKFFYLLLTTVMIISLSRDVK